MSNLIYGPDGKPIPSQDEPSPSSQKETSSQDNTREKTDIPYGASRSNPSPAPNPYESSNSASSPAPNIPRERSIIDMFSFGCGIVGIFMIGSSGYLGIALMFGAGLAAVIFAILAKKNNGSRSRFGTIGLVFGIISIVFSLLTIFSMMFLLTHQEEMKQIMETYLQMYEQMTGQPLPEDALNNLFQY